MFEGPARAIQCGQSIQAGIGALGLDVRIGIHTGECKVAGGDVSGIAVHIAARVGELAGAGQVLVSPTVRDLVAGSGIGFEDLGARTLRGIDGQWTVCAARPG